MSSRAAAGVLAAVIFAVGLIIGFIPHSTPLSFTQPGGGSTLSCGSAFFPADVSSDAKLADAENSIGAAITGDSPGKSAADYEAACSDAVGSPRLIALVVLGVGGLVGLFLLLTSRGFAARGQGAVPVVSDREAPPQPTVGS